MSQLRTYVSYPNHDIETKFIEVTESLVYEKRLVKMLHYRIKQLYIRSILLVEVSWAHHALLEATGRNEEE